MVLCCTFVGTCNKLIFAFFPCRRLLVRMLFATSFVASASLLLLASTTDRVESASMMTRMASEVEDDMLTWPEDQMQV